jgi:hypothetical protein
MKVPLAAYMIYYSLPYLNVMLGDIASRQHHSWWRKCNRCDRIQQIDDGFILLSMIGYQTYGDGCLLGE